MVASGFDGNGVGSSLQGGVVDKVLTSGRVRDAGSVFASSRNLDGELVRGRDHVAHGLSVGELVVADGVLGLDGERSELSGSGGG